mgnify:CR=1 FL=1
MASKALPLEKKDKFEPTYVEVSEIFDHVEATL